MSSLSTLPKGDSAWLLRKAIERIIQQISVLETNIGSSTTGNSANTQIIFNDNGVLRGDTGLTYNKTTDLLTVASATITGDLTVGNATNANVIFNGVTNVLNIGFGSLRGGSTYGDVRLWTDRFRIYNNAGTQIIKNISGTNGDETWYDGAGGTRMTLNSTGLLVGTTSANGSASNSVKNVGGVFSTVNGATGSIATGVAATLFTAPSEAVFIVSAYIVGSASPANYNAVAIVRVSGGTAAITTISTASNLTISLSGLNVQATQTSGINQAFAYSAIRIS